LERISAVQLGHQFVCGRVAGYERTHSGKTYDNLKEEDTEEEAEFKMLAHCLLLLSMLRASVSSYAVLAVSHQLLQMPAAKTARCRCSLDPCVLLPSQYLSFRTLVALTVEEGCLVQGQFEHVRSKGLVSICERSLLAQLQTHCPSMLWISATLLHE
jgi:hypothetical protein